MVDDILLDLSGGQGIVLDPVVLWPYIEVMQQAGYLSAQEGKPDPFGIAVAGGITDKTMKAAMCLFQVYSTARFSIDTEAGVRTGDDRVDYNALAAYIQAAGEVFETVEEEK